MQINNAENPEYADKDMYDGPELAAQFEFNRTKDPATGQVPYERLLAALEQTAFSKNANASLINSLSWIERGPNSDVPGPSNGNTRANNGIASGRIRSIMVDSTDATYKTVWVGGVDGGLWKTTDITVSPANWTMINDHFSNLAIADICQDPRPGFQNIMYFCTGESYFNSDAVRGVGVFKSMDNGATWTFLTSTSTYTYGTRIICDYLGNVYLATRAGLFRSTDGGTNWSDITPSGMSVRICDLEISSTGAAGRLHVVGGIFSAQSYRYTDIPVTVTSGAGWTAPSTAFPSYNNRAEICVSGSTLYALPADGSHQVPTIYKSTDGGANWAATAGQPAGGWVNGQAWYDLSCAIDPSSGGATCIVGGIDTWKTTNGGANWTKISAWVGTSGQYVHADQHDIQWFDGGNKLLFGCDGGIHYSADKGTTIRDRNVDLRIKQFYSVAIHPTATNYFLAGAQDNGTHQFNNAGLSNTIEVTGGDGAFTAIDQDEPLFQYGSYVFNSYRRSTNGGATWSSVTLNAGTGQFINPFDYDNTANIMYCGDIADNFRRWTDPHTGATSEVVNITSIVGAVTAVSVSPYTANKVFFGTDNGRVVQVDGANTIASGSAGIDRSAGLPGGTVSCINFGTDDQNLIMCESNYGINNIWLSTNGGTGWTAIDGNLPDMPVRWVMFYPGDNTKAYIATETGVWETDFIDGASTVWTANNTFPSVRTDMIKYRALDRTIAAATHGRGLWTATIPNVTTPDIQFLTSAGNATESTTSTITCRGYTDYTANMQILNPPTGSGSATVTLQVAGGGTALQGIDYDITTNGSFATPSMQLFFAVGVTTLQPFTIRVYDDAAVESAESFTLNYSLAAGSTNAQAGSSNQTFTYTINDNDAGPVGSSNSSNTVGTYDANANAQAPFHCTQSKFRLQALFTAAELISSGITTARNFTSMTLRVVAKNSSQPFSGFTISMANTSVTNLSTGFVNPAFTTVYPATSYSTVTGDNLFTFTTPFAWDGSSNVVINFCYDNASACVSSDIVEVSFPLATHYTTFSDGVASSPCTAGASFISTARVKATFGTTVPGTSISTALNSSNTAYLGPNDDVPFYDGSGNILARIKNLTSFNYGCTTIEIDRAGTGATQFWNAVTSNYLTTKSYRVIPTNNTTTGSYEITMYYTTAEVNGFNAAVSPSTFATSQIVKISNGFYIPDVSPGSPHFSDAYVKGATAAAFGATGSTITATFSNTGFSGFAVGTPGNSLLTADYRSKGSGNYSDGTKWEYNIFGANYIDANQAPTSGSNVMIQTAHAITLDAAQTVAAGKTLAVNGSLNAGTNVISGAGGFTLAAGGTLATANTGANGISQNIAVAGTKIFTDGANYTFNGASTAPFGSLFTTVTPNNVAIGANITLDKPTYVTGALGFSGSNRVVTTAGNLTIGSTVSATARITDLTKDFFTAGAVSGNSISGTATVERYIATSGAGIDGRRWRLLSGISTNTSQNILASWQEGGAAVSNLGTWLTKPGGGNGFDGTSISSSILYHTQGGAGSPSWTGVAASNTGSINDRQGYMLFVRGDRNATPANTLNAATTLRTNGTIRQGDQSAVLVSATGSGRTLLGNPYASPIDVDPIFLAFPTLDQAMYIWDATLTGNHGVGGYRLVERNGGAYQQTPVVLGGGPNADPNSRYIHSGQGFFLKASVSDANVVITESMKAATLSAVNPIVNTPGDQQIFVNLKIVNPGNVESLADGIRVRYDGAYSAGTDDDIEKMGNFGENISSFRNNTKWIVEKRPMITSRDTIFLRMTDLELKDYRLETGTFDFVQSGATAFLEDSWLNTSTPLNLTGGITHVDFNVTTDPASANPDRFRIVFSLSGPLPVNFTSVSAAALLNNINVEWKVSNQVNIVAYEVERSKDGINFTKVNTQPATGFNGSHVSYNWLDLNPFTGDNFYRIRSMGMGGDIKISQVVKVSMGKATPDITVYPNPVVNRTVNLQFSHMQSGVYRIQLFNIKGQRVLTQSVNHAGGSATQTLLLGDGLARGNYRLTFIKPDGTRVVRQLLVSD